MNFDQANGSWYSTANNQDRALFREWLKGHLAMGKVVVTFNKVNGDRRDMTCTLDPSIVPFEQSKDSPIKDLTESRDYEPTNQAVWDVEASAWRSFRWDKITQISFTLGS
jgi:hypothetical protein